MCGIVGLLDWSPRGMMQADYRLFFEMLHADALRGFHGTGLFAVDKHGSQQTIRIGGPPNQLIADKAFQKVEQWLTKSDVQILVGHNRYATTGKKTTEHAHPFVEDHITLVHNGTLRNVEILPKGKKLDVDSHALCHAIAKEGVKKVIPELFGAWTIVFYDSKEKTINFLRNSERPLYFAVLDNNIQIAFASEKDMLTWILERNYNYKYEIKELPTNTLVTYKLGAMKPQLTTLEGAVFAKKSITAEEIMEDWGQSLTDLGTTTASASGTQTIVTPVHQPYGRTSSPSSEQKGKESHKNTKTTSDGKYVSVDFLHDLSKGGFVRVEPTDWDVLGKAAEEHYSVQAVSDDHPDIEFRITLKGKKNLEAILEAQYGMRGKIISILKSQESPARGFPHRIWLNSPEPCYTLEPVIIPDHALVKL